MTPIREDIAFPRSANATFFEVDGHPVLDESDLDFYLFNREARMDEVWGSGRAGAVGRMGSDRIQPANLPGLCGVESENHPTRLPAPRVEQNEFSRTDGVART
jgi:hypothetical protein